MTKLPAQEAGKQEPERGSGLAFATQMRRGEGNREQGAPPRFDAHLQRTH